MTKKKTNNSPPSTTEENQPAFIDFFATVFQITVPLYAIFDIPYSLPYTTSQLSYHLVGFLICLSLLIFLIRFRGNRRDSFLKDWVIWPLFVKGLVILAFAGIYKACVVFSFQSFYPDFPISLQGVAVIEMIYDVLQWIGVTILLITFTRDAVKKSCSTRYSKNTFLRKLLHWLPVLALAIVLGDILLNDVQRIITLFRMGMG